jgi:hypothetical protein
MSPPPGKWSNARATELIRQCASNPQFTPHWKRHALERLHERDLVAGDVLYALKNGFVLEEPEPSDIEGYFKYTVESKTPNSEGRRVKVVVVPGAGCELKIITVMWKDEN